MTNPFLIHRRRSLHHRPRLGSGHGRPRRVPRRPSLSSSPPRKQARPCPTSVPSSSTHPAVRKPSSNRRNCSRKRRRSCNEAVAIFRANGAQVIAGWRPTVMAAFEQIRDAARTVPVGCDDAAAFNAPPEQQASWCQAQAACALVYRADSCRRAARNARLMASCARDGGDVFSLWSNPWMIDDSRAISSGYEFSELPADRVHRLLEAARRGADFHYPTGPEQDAAAAAYLDLRADLKTAMVDRRGPLPTGPLPAVPAPTGRRARLASQDVRHKVA